MERDLPSEQDRECRWVAVALEQACRRGDADDRSSAWARVGELYGAWHEAYRRLAEVRAFAAAMRLAPTRPAIAKDS